MIAVEASNIDSFIGPGSVAYLSCDIESTNSSSSIRRSILLDQVLASEPNAVVLYTTSGGWCWSDGLAVVGNIFTVVNAHDTRTATSYLEKVTRLSAKAQVSISQNLRSRDKPDKDNTRDPKKNDTALIALYAIGGSVSSLFILTTAATLIRAFRYPERYGPRDGHDGDPSQTRIQGLAQAVLDTFPVVKFARNKNSSTANADIELQAREAHKDAACNTAEAEPSTCSICTEDFTVHEDVRILPCKHEFHPRCIDPWLVQQSTKCPLW